MPAFDPRPTLGAPDDDPHIWLEEVEGEAPLAWVKEQNARTLARFGGPRFKADTETLAAIFDRPDNIPYISRRAGLIYNFWQDAAHKRGIWRRTTLAAFGKDAPDWDVLLDVDALAAAEGEDWVWQGASTFPPAHERAILRLSRGGSDACVLREFDLTRKAFLQDGFFLPEAKGGTSWLDADTLLLGSAYGGEAMQTRSGYARTVRLWRRGADPLSAPVLFEVAEESMAGGAVVDRTGDGERVWFLDRFGFFDEHVWLGDRDGPNVQLDIPTDAQLGWNGDWFVLKTRTSWTVGGKTYAPDTMLGGRIADIAAGRHQLEVLFEASERVALKSFFWAGGRLLIAILDNLEAAL